MKRERKRGRLALALAVILCLGLSLAGGYFIGKNSGGSGILGEITGFISPHESVKKNEAPVIDLKPAPEDRGEGYDVAEIYEKVSPSVVSVNVYSGMSVSPIGSGTGIVMTGDGYIITNAHVVNNGQSYNVVFSDGSQARATLVGADDDTDLAVIKVSAGDLTAAEFGDSNSLKIGERVVAIGNAGGLSGTCTNGIISGLSRDVNSNTRSFSLIQTNAAINPGNSGGPLINGYGQVIGITSSKIANVDYEGIGFAIPISDALPVIQSLIENGYVTGRRVLGVQVIELNESNGPINGLPSHGVYIATINEGSDLGNKGVRERDVIIEADGKEINTSDDLLALLSERSPGDIMTLKIYRPETEQTFEASVVLIEDK